MGEEFPPAVRAKKEDQVKRKCEAVRREYRGKFFSFLHLHPHPKPLHPLTIVFASPFPLMPGGTLLVLFFLLIFFVPQQWNNAVVSAANACRCYFLRISF
ncbi:hypothetical protein CEXT_802041 [Caerostris extrusa]|uniref:Transmembrane protein n=1 Tax=Caerostris extrusa TaxID=172846 RepID=A0AAV4P6S2_CAEEX|nr:hypothetical protein CEXT_802041 [Caerostris extrusa]